MSQMVRRSPPVAGVQSSRLGHSMWVSWMTKRGLGRFSSGFLQFCPTSKFNSTISPHSSHPFHFISSPLWWCDRRCRPAPMLFTDLQYKGFTASYPSIRPSVGHELRMLRNFQLLQKRVGRQNFVKYSCISYVYSEFNFFKNIVYIWYHYS